MTATANTDQQAPSLLLQTQHRLYQPDATVTDVIAFLRVLAKADDEEITRDPRNDFYAARMARAFGRTKGLVELAADALARCEVRLGNES